MMKTAVLGTGAIGSCIGADLSEAGLDVLLIDQWPEHVEAMKNRGLSISASGIEKKIQCKSSSSVRAFIN